MKTNNFEYTIGNLKIPKTTMIFNMGPAKTCPSWALGLCQLPAGGWHNRSKCYAYRAERFRPNVLKYRIRQADYWKSAGYYKIAVDIVTALNKHKGVKYIRVNEAGDFRNQFDVNKLISTIKTVASVHPDIIFYMYTARRDLNFDKRPANLVINRSGFMVDNQYNAVSKYSRGAKKCTTCHTCGKCRKASGVIIENLYH